mmetsp:Transcript_114425/g.323479  ORF Transcript_114425/g.323479 Transcript_114425/m.323479 type:complete len:106 (-) Transcript_114425:371-688(-)
MPACASDTSRRKQPPHFHAGRSGQDVRNLLKAIAGVKQCQAMGANGGADNCGVVAQFLRGVMERQAMGLHGGHHQLAIALQAFGSVVEGQSAIADGGKYDVAVSP